MATALQPDIPWICLEEAILRNTPPEHLIMAVHLFDVTRSLAPSMPELLAMEFVAIARATAEPATRLQAEDRRMA